MTQIHPIQQDFGTIGPIWFFLFFIGMWVSVSFIISRTGWHAFAKRYPITTRPAGTSYNSPTSWFDNPLGSYGNILRVVFSESGIYVYVCFLFRVGHPPFLVPWESVVGVKQMRFLFFRPIKIDIKDSCGDLHITLTKKAGRDLFAYYQSAQNEKNR